MAWVKILLYIFFAAKLCTLNSIILQAHTDTSHYSSFLLLDVGTIPVLSYSNNTLFFFLQQYHTKCIRSHPAGYERKNLRRGKLRRLLRKRESPVVIKRWQFFIHVLLSKIYISRPLCHPPHNYPPSSWNNRDMMWWDIKNIFPFIYKQYHACIFEWANNIMKLLCSENFTSI